MTYIFVLVVISGVIAYLGDALGTMVGKKRLTVFGLRPRITALVVAISTGILITMLTLGVATFLSEDVRTALFSMDRIRRDIDQLQAEIRGLVDSRDRLEQEKKELFEDVERLTSQVRIKETESVVFRKDESLAVCIIKAGIRPEEVMKELTTLIIKLADKVRRKGVMVKDEINFFTENKEQLSIMAAHIASSSQDLVVAAIAAENINTGEELGNVRFLALPNNLIFTRNQEIASIEIDGKSSRSLIARNLKSFMDLLNHEVVNHGMIPNLLTDRFGDLSSESMISFYDLVNEIRELNRKITLIATVSEDTYAIGPLDVTFKFEEAADKKPTPGGNE